MQRLGICKFFALWSGKFNSISAMSQLLQSELTKREEVPFDRDYLKWLRKRPNEKPRFEAEKWILTQLQDFYIYHHPSQTGWLSKHGFREYTESLPRKLDIVDSSYAITDMGQVLLKGLMDEKELQAFSNISEDCNPFLLTIQQKVFFLYNLLISDGDFLIPFAYAIYRNFVKQRFTYLDAGNLIPDVIDHILPFFSGLAYTSSDRRQLDDLENMKLSIQRDIQDKSERKGSGSRREQECITRLEWMVDLDILTKISPRTYIFTELGKIVISNLRNRYEEYLASGYADQAVQKLIDFNFYEIMGLSYFTGSSPANSTFNLLKFIKSSYDILKGISGYCLYRPLLLLANIRAKSQGQRAFLEYDNGVQLLEKTFQDDPEKIYYTTDRFGTDVQIKIF